MEEKCYLGIDLNDRYAMISYYQLNKKEPETISSSAGGNMYQIPTLLAKKKSLAQWYYGDDARKKAKTSEVICVDALLQRALHREQIYIEGETYEAIDLLAVFLKKVMELPKVLGNVVSCNCLVLTIEHLSQENMEVLQEVAAKLGLKPEQFIFIDYKEKAVDKLKRVLGIFKENRDDICLLWYWDAMPEETLKINYPMLWKEFEQLVRGYREEAWGIFETETNKEWMVRFSDAYYGDGSPVSQAMVMAGKPVMLQNFEC